MAIYNKGRESPRRPEERTFKKEARPTRTLVYEETDFDTNLRTMRSEGEFTMFVRTLKRAREIGELADSDFDYYMGEAHKKIKRLKNSQTKTEEKQKQTQNTSKIAVPETISSDIEEKEDKEESNREKKVRGERNIDEESLRAKDEEKLGTKIGKFKAFAEFMQTPIARVLFFIIIGVFLLIYLTKNSMADVFGSPLVIVLVIVFMLLVLGKGGKTRSHNYDDSENRY